MKTCTVITAKARRESIFPETRVELPLMLFSPGPPPDMHSPEMMEWARVHNWAVNYNVHYSKKEKAKKLATKLEKALTKDPTGPHAARLMHELKLIRTSDYGELTPLERWERLACQLPDDIGGGHLAKNVIRNHLTPRYSGKILEAMCGFNSYFRWRKNTTVVALDYCEEALLRYPYPHRKRILFDLDDLENVGTIPEFTDEEFDVVSFCFGFRYPESIIRVMRECRRILKPGGILSFAENPGAGYSRLVVRDFKPRTCRLLLLQSGFSRVTCEILQTKSDGSLEDPLNNFYHLEAIK